MAVRYRWGVLGSKLGPPRTRQDGVARFRDRLDDFSENAFQMKRYSKTNFSRVLTRQEALDRLVQQAVAEKDDADREAWLFKHVATGKTFIFREVVVQPTIELPSGSDLWHPKLRQAYTLGFGEFSRRTELEFWGAYNCRNMRNSSQASMHCRWCNGGVLACDFGHEFGANGLQDQFDLFLSSRISGLVIITHRDNSLHRDHCHVQVGSNRSGTPCCMGGTA